MSFDWETAVTSVSVLPQLDPTSYARSSLHAEDRVWVEKNCYVDIWIEVLNALGLEPTAIMPFTIALDFEGDQWTFFKPPHDELRDLYGIDVQELTVWRPLIEHAVEHLRAGRMISTEADAFWLPDTSGTDYRSQHTKSTIVINELNIAEQRLGYFHNAGYYALQGEDFVKTFRLDAAHDPTFMPFFAELVNIDRLIRRPTNELAAMSWQLLQRHFARIPLTNPIKRFSERFAKDLPEIQERGLGYYHAWAFAATRQLGAACEALAINLRWLESNGYSGLTDAAQAFGEISNANKTFILKGARAVNTKRTPDHAAIFDGMIAAWDKSMSCVKNALE